jgi:hypothetical protein
VREVREVREVSLAAARQEMSAATARQDKAAFARFLSDDITSIDSAGKLRNKSAAIEDMPSGSSQVSAEIIEYGNGAVVAIGREGDSPARIIQAWVRKNNEWQNGRATGPPRSRQRDARVGAIIGVTCEFRQ